MQYDFSVLPNGSQQIEVKGKFFKYLEGAGKIRVRELGGDFIDLMPGQGVWNRNYSSLIVQDRSGSLNFGTIIAGDFDFRDDTIVGSVSTIDDAKKRTEINSAFSVYGRSLAAGGKFGYIQLYNSSADKKIIVESLDLQCATSQEIIGIGISNVSAVLSTPSNFGQSKLSNGAQSANARLYVDQLNTTGDPLFVLKTLGVIGVNQFVTTTKKFVEPIILMPGMGLICWSGSINTDLFITFEFFEQ